jgi:hypothetical protein
MISEVTRLSGNQHIRISEYRDIRISGERTCYHFTCFPDLLDPDALTL